MVNLKILLVAKLSDNSLNSILKPIIQMESVSQIYVLRDKPGDFISNKVTFLTNSNPDNGNKLRHLNKVAKGIKICKDYEIDFIVGVLLYPHGYIGRLISIFTHKPYIHVTVAGHREFWLMGKIIEKVNYWFFKNSHLITVTGSNTRNYLVSKGYDPKKIVTLPNVIRMEYYQDFNNARDYDIVSMSRLDKNKNLLLMVKAIARLKDSLKLNTIIAGDGTELNNLIDAGRTFGVENSIQFPGWINEQGKNELLNKAKIFVLCSKGEGFPLSLLEAMACGCVPIVTNVGDVSDVIVNGYNGYILTNYDDEKELAEKIEFLIQHPEKIEELSIRAKEVKNRYSFDNVTKIWENIFI